MSGYTQLTASFALRFDTANPAWFDQNTRFDGLLVNQLSITGPITNGNCQGQIKRVVTLKATTNDTSYLPDGITGIDKSSIRNLNVAPANNSNLWVLDTVDFPQLAFGKQIPPIGISMSAFANDDFTPAAGGLLRLPANLFPPSLPFDIRGRSTNPLGDMVGAMALAASA